MLNYPDNIKYLLLSDALIVISLLFVVGIIYRIFKDFLVDKNMIDKITNTIDNFKKIFSNVDNNFDEAASNIKNLNEKFTSLNENFKIKQQDIEKKCGDLKKEISLVEKANDLNLEEISLFLSTRINEIHAEIGAFKERVEKLESQHKDFLKVIFRFKEPLESFSETANFFENHREDLNKLIEMKKVDSGYGESISKIQRTLKEMESKLIFHNELIMNSTLQERSDYSGKSDSRIPQRMLSSDGKSEFYRGLIDGFNKTLSMESLNYRRILRRVMGNFINAYSTWRMEFVEGLRGMQLPEIDDYNNFELINVTEEIKFIQNSLAQQTEKVFSESVFIESLFLKDSSTFPELENFQYRLNLRSDSEDREPANPWNVDGLYQYYSGKYLSIPIKYPDVCHDGEIFNLFLITCILKLRDVLDTYIALSGKIGDLIDPEIITKNIEIIGDYLEKFNHITGGMNIDQIPACKDDVYDPLKHTSFCEIPDKDRAYFIKTIMQPGYSYNNQIIRKVLVEIQS